MTGHRDDHGALCAACGGDGAVRFEDGAGEGIYDPREIFVRLDPVSETPVGPVPPRKHPPRMSFCTRLLHRHDVALPAGHAPDPNLRRPRQGLPVVAITQGCSDVVSRDEARPPDQFGVGREGQLVGGDEVLPRVPGAETPVFPVSRGVQPAGDIHRHREVLSARGAHQLHVGGGRAVLPRGSIRLHRHLLPVRDRLHGGSHGALPEFVVAGAPPGSVRGEHDAVRLPHGARDGGGGAPVPVEQGGDPHAARQGQAAQLTPLVPPPAVHVPVRHAEGVAAGARRGHALHLPLTEHGRREDRGGLQVVAPRPVPGRTLGASHGGGVERTRHAQQPRPGGARGHGAVGAGRRREVHLRGARRRGGIGLFRHRRLHRRGRGRGRSGGRRRGLARHEVGPGGRLHAGHLAGGRGGGGRAARGGGRGGAAPPMRIQHGTDRVGTQTQLVGELANVLLRVDHGGRGEGRAERGERGERG
mmetsp:Transcript_25107/g.49937  ORF Transcript_25107/g.49937 Transcript_25107/m.49937 type:complete len:473 (-) Transcript_25107:31-1449(-)